MKNQNPRTIRNSYCGINDYAGTHDIVWNNIKFPVTGNYQIEIEVDDEVE